MKYYGFVYLQHACKQNFSVWKTAYGTSIENFFRVYTVRENQGKTYLFRDGQGKSGRVREFNEKVGKSQRDFFGKFLSPMNQDPLFILAIVCQTSFCWWI